MRCMILIIGFAFIMHVKSQLEVNVEDILYEEEDEEDDETVVTTTTRRTRQRRSTTPTTTRPPTTTTTLPPQMTLIATNLTNANSLTTASQNASFVLTQTNSSFFGSQISSTAGNGVTTERVHYVLGQVGRIWNNVGALNITGIVDQSLGIRNHQFVRPLITGILNAVFCNPVTFSNNNCRKKGKSDGNDIPLFNSTTTPIPLNQTLS